jgi:hypothetical protein
MAGVIDGMNRGPKSPPRLRRANAKLALTDPDQVQITGNIHVQVINSEVFHVGAMPTSPEDGQMFLLVEGDSTSVRLCFAYDGTWYEEVLTEMASS